MEQFGGCGESEQYGGCGGYSQMGGSKRSKQCGGNRLTPDKKSQWLSEVREIYEKERKVGGERYTYQEAMKLASARRKGPVSRSTKTIQNGSGHKIGRPLTFEDAHRILNQYYRDRANYSN